MIGVQGIELPDWIQISIAVAMLIGVILSYLQLRSISRSLWLTRQANAVQVIAHCSSLYEKIMGDIPKTDSQSDVDIWWYRYWELMTMEFTFFVKAMLDPDIYQLWMTELANVYNLPPKSGMETRAERHQDHLSNTIPHYEEIKKFFARLEHIAANKDVQARSELIDALIDDFRPKNSIFKKIL